MALPELTVDLDGVLCRPVGWFNLAISRDIQRPPEFRERPQSSPAFLNQLIQGPTGQTLRYSWRPPLPMVREGLAELASIRRLVLLSGRSELSREVTERWLIRHGMRDFFSEILLNNRRLSNVSFKILICRERHGSEHVDDDARVAYFLANCAGRTVYLISYARNAGLPYPSEVKRVKSLIDAARVMRASPRDDP